MRSLSGLLLSPVCPYAISPPTSTNDFACSVFYQPGLLLVSLSTRALLLSQRGPCGLVAAELRHSSRAASNDQNYIEWRIAAQQRPLHRIDVAPTNSWLQRSGYPFLRLRSYFSVSRGSVLHLPVQEVHLARHLNSNESQPAPLNLRSKKATASGTCCIIFRGLKIARRVRRTHLKGIGAVFNQQTAHLRKASSTALSPLPQG